ncbi:MAG: hypothetical protein OXB99_07875 [Acidimicrobiaceae bacterium]|nr:hypothetical protein [Acidimicrobiaceae bacterium]
MTEEGRPNPADRRCTNSTARASARTMLRWQIVAACAVLALACSPNEPADQLDADDSTPPPAGQSELRSDSATERTRVPRPTAAPATTRPPRSNEKGTDDSEVDVDEQQAPPTAEEDSEQSGTGSVEPQPEVSETRAPEWPFRGLVRAFSHDVDDDGDADLVVQYANAVDRTTTEIVIKNLAASSQTCRGGIRYNSTGIHVGAGTARVFIPWTEQAEINSSVRISPEDVARYRTQPTTESIRAGGTSFSVQDWGEYALLTADGTTSRLEVSEAVIGLRGTDGEFIAVTTIPSEPIRCEEQRTFVFSMRTGEMVACGPHTGDIELISPPDEGLLVAHVHLPETFDLANQACDDGVAELSVDSPSQPGQAAGLMAHFAQLPPASIPFGQRCTTGLGDLNLPDDGFSGAVRVFDTQDEICRDDASYRRVGVWLHDSRTRVTTRFTLNGFRLPDCPAEIRVTEDGLEFTVVELGQTSWIGYRQVLLPWGSQPRSDPIPSQFARSLQSEIRATPSWNDSLFAGATEVGIAMHANGVRLNVGSLVSGYTLSDRGIPGPPPQSSLMGDYRVFGRSAMLDGTDGELLAFSVWQDSSPCSSLTTFVMSMRDGAIIACDGVDNGDLLLLAPSNDDLSVGDVLLAPSGWVDPASCPTGLAEDFFRHVEQLPPRAPPAEFKPVLEPDLPETTAPDLPFRGVIRSSLRYDPNRYSHDLVVEFLSSAGRTASEIAFTPEALTGFEPGLSVVPDGLVVARRGGTGDRLVIPWGSVPEFVSVDEPGSERWASDLPALARHPTSLPLADGAVQIAGYEPWPVGVLTLGHNDNATTLVLSAPPAEVPDSLDAVLGQRSPSWTTSLRGTDGDTLAFTYLHSYFDDCLSLCGLELTYLVSLTTGEVLTCGVEPRYSEFAFVAPPDASSPSAPVKLPPTGWLNPEPCLAGNLANGLGCSILVHESEPQIRCIREFSLGSAAEGITGAQIIPVRRNPD